MSVDMFLHAIFFIFSAYVISIFVPDWVGSLIIFLSVFCGIGLAFYSGENEDVGLLMFRKFSRTGD